MCAVCGFKYGHSKNCPEVSCDTVVAYCVHCGEPIIAGEKIFELEDELYHEECFKDAAVEILEEKYGARKRVAVGYEGE